ncbi:MAG: hypothetical protein JO082_03285 [Mycobacterium sp.]|nr:hypothetical protein [Mycobacterium sp.]
MGLTPWPMIDPASAYSMMTAGDGGVSTQVYSAGLRAWAAGGHGTVAASGVNLAGMQGGWRGLSALSAAASGAQLNVDQLSEAEKALAKAEVAQAAADLHTMTVPRMVTHVQANANRGEYVADNAINPWVLGALTPRLVELDLEYFGYMWPNNASAGVGFGAGLDVAGAALASLAGLPTLAGASLGAPVMAAADVAANGGIAALGAAMSGAEQAATAAISPAVSSAAAPVSSMLGSTAVAAPHTAGSSAAQPLAAVVTHAPAVPPSLAQPPAPVMSMFAAPPVAAVSAAAPVTAAAPVQTLSPAPAVPGPAAAPGVTSFVKPADPFAAPSAGRAGGLGSGLLNAAALRGPVSTMALSTTAPSTLHTATTAAQPLANVQVLPPPPQPAPPTPPQRPPLPDAGNVQTLNPPPQTTRLLTPPPAPPQPVSPPAPPHSPPAPSSDAGGGVHMLGTGPGGATQAPPAPIPLDPEPTPPPPPPPVRGRAPDGLRPPVDGDLTPGPPSRPSERGRGAEHLWDDQGGEWRYHGDDQGHNPHWDYKPPGKNSRWQRIPIGDLPPLKGGVDPSLIAQLPPWMQNLLAPGVPGGPQNPLLAPYPGATMPAPPPASTYVPPPGSSFMPPIGMPDLDPGSAMPIAGGEVVVIEGILFLVIAGLLICLA